MNRLLKGVFQLILLFLMTAAFGQNEVRFDESGLQSVLKRAKAEHKPVFYLLYASWCPHCNKMKQEVFKDAAVANFLNTNFVNAWQDIEKGEGDYFKREYKIIQYPTFLFFDEHGRLLYHFNGEFKADNFLAEVKNVLVPEKQLPYLEQQFYDDPSNSKKCLDFLVALKKGSERSEINHHAQKYFETQTDAQMVSETNWRIIANGVSDIESRPFQYVLKHPDEFAAVSSAKRVQKKLVNIVTELLQPYTEKPDTISYFKKRPIAQMVHVPKTDSLIFRYDLMVAERSQNWKSYTKTAQQSAQQYAWTDAKILKEIASNITQHNGNKTVLLFAEKAGKQAVQINSSYENNMTLAKVYQKLNDSKSALLFAEKARKIYADVGFSTREADEMIAELTTKKTQ